MDRLAPVRLRDRDQEPSVDVLAVAIDAGGQPGAARASEDAVDHRCPQPHRRRRSVVSFPPRANLRRRQPLGEPPTSGPLLLVLSIAVARSPSAVPRRRSSGSETELRQKIQLSPDPLH